MALRRRHVVLLIEDEVDSARATAEILEGLDFEVAVVGSAEEARPAIDAGQFCFTIVDLQMKAKQKSAESHIEVGQSLLTYIRERFPTRNEHDKHLLQILVMSGHASDAKHIIQSFRDRADDFIFKDLDENAVSFLGKIRSALLDSGRHQHGDCASIMTRAARGTTSHDGPQSEIGISRISVPASCRGKKTEIRLDDALAMIPNASFLLLLTLIAARLDSEEWVSSKEHGAGEEGWRQASRLKDELEKHAGKGARALIENDGAGSYRLRAEVTVGTIDWATLAKHSDARVRAIAAKRK